MVDSELDKKTEDKGASYNKNQVYLSMIIPIVGWIYIILGPIFFPLYNWFFLFIWIVVIILSVGVHGAQLYFAIPAGKKVNIPIWKIIFKTMLLGATWWKPLRDGIISK